MIFQFKLSKLINSSQIFIQNQHSISKMQHKNFLFQRKASIRLEKVSNIMDNYLKQRMGSKLQWAWMNLKEFVQYKVSNGNIQKNRKVQFGKKQKSAQQTIQTVNQQQFSNGSSNGNRRLPKCESLDTCHAQSLRSTQKYINQDIQRQFEDVILNRLKKLQKNFIIQQIISSSYQNQGETSKNQYQQSSTIKPLSTEYSSIQQQIKTYNLGSCFKILQQSSGTNRQRVVPKLCFKNSEENDTTRYKKYKQIARSNQSNKINKIQVNKKLKGICKTEIQDQRQNISQKLSNKFIRSRENLKTYKQKDLKSQSHIFQDQFSKYKPEINMIKQCLSKLNQLEIMNNDYNKYPQKKQKIKRSNLNYSQNLLRSRNNKDNQQNIKTIILVPASYQFLVI